MNHIIKQLHASPWKGIISEVGIGLEFSASVLAEPGASKTVLFVECDYAKIDYPKNGRAVSLNTVQYKALHCYSKACKNTSKDNAFGLAISGVHYTDRMSHAWVALMTEKGTAHMHVNIELITERQTVANRLARCVLWFLEGALLSTRSWKDLIASCPEYVDVLYAPDLTNADRLGLITSTRPLLYFKGQFHRTIDFLRQKPTIYPGSFNPIHKDHLRIGEAALFEISTFNQEKGYILKEDLLHRLAMLNECSVPVLLTGSCGFIYQKDRCLRDLWDQSYTYIVGSDTWNRIINPVQYPNETFLSQAMRDSRFLIFERKNYVVMTNDLAEKLRFSIDPMPPCLYNSTSVRNGDLNLEVIPEPVYQYIKKNKLYAN